jgi:hypothetical protein
MNEREKQRERCKDWHRRNKDRVSTYSRRKRDEWKAYWKTHNPYLEGGEKRCSRCGHSLPRTDFYKANYKKDGLDCRCKDCAYLKNEAGALRRMLSKAKTRAKRRGLEFSLRLEDIKVPKTCPVLGIPLSYGWGRGCTRRKNFNSPSLDRRNNTRGYTKDNVRVISLRANHLKGDASVEELKAVLAYMCSE